MNQYLGSNKSDLNKVLFVNYCNSNLSRQDMDYILIGRKSLFVRQERAYSLALQESYCHLISRNRRATFANCIANCPEPHRSYDHLDYLAKVGYRSNVQKIKYSKSDQKRRNIVDIARRLSS